MYISEVFSGRPADERTSPEKECYDFLDSLGIDYRRADHDQAFTMDDCIAVGNKLGVSICKNLFLTNRQKTKFYLLLMPGDKEFRTKNLSAQIGSARLSFADEETMQRLIGTAPGSASILGLMNDKENQVRLLIDKDVLSAEFFGCHPCRNSSSLCFSTSELTGKVIPALAHEVTEVIL